MGLVMSAAKPRRRRVAFFLRGTVLGVWQKTAVCSGMSVFPGRGTQTMLWCAGVCFFLSLFPGIPGKKEMRLFGLLSRERGRPLRESFGGGLNRIKLLFLVAAGGATGGSVGVVFARGTLGPGEAAL